MIHIRIFPTLSCVCLSPFQVETFDTIPICKFSAYSWGSINYLIMKKWSEMWWSFSIMIWWTFKIHKTCCLSFSTWMHPTYSCVFYIIPFMNTSSIQIRLKIFCIIKLSNIPFWKNTTPIIINIFLSVIILYIYFIKFCTMTYKVKKYWFVEFKI